MAEDLVTAGRACCYCSPETIQQKREAAEAAGGGWRDAPACATEQIAAHAAAGTPRAIRFKVPPGRTTFDRVRGVITFDNANIEDFVILRSDRQPTYHLSVVADDIAMAITDVVRGDDHISNTPKHVLLFESFAKATPRFARTAHPRRRQEAAEQSATARRR